MALIEYPAKLAEAQIAQVGLGYLAACAAHQPALRRRIGAHKYCRVTYERHRAGILHGENVVEINGLRPAMPIVLGFSLDLGAIGLLVWIGHRHDKVRLQLAQRVVEVELVVS